MTLATLKNQAVLKQGLFPLFTAAQAIKVIGLMGADQVRPLGLDAVVLTNETVQPFLEHSLDLSNNFDNPWEEAVQFLEKYILVEIWFEIVPEIEFWFD